MKVAKKNCMKKFEMEEYNRCKTLLTIRRLQKEARKITITTMLLLRDPALLEVSVAFIQMSKIWLKGNNFCFEPGYMLEASSSCSSNNILPNYSNHLSFRVHKKFHHSRKLQLTKIN